MPWISRVSSVFRSLLLAAAVAGFSGCATNPISKTLRQQARPVRLAEVQAHPAPYIGSVVIWGGRILQTVNATNGASIYVLKLPLYNDARPVRSASVAAADSLLTAPGSLTRKCSRRDAW